MPDDRNCKCTNNGFLSGQYRNFEDNNCTCFVFIILILLLFTGFGR